MQRDGQPEQAGVEKKKADYAEICLPIFEIDFSPRRNQWHNDLRIDNKIEQGEIPPVGGEKWSHANKICGDRGLPPQNQCSNFSSAASGLAPSEVAMA